MMKTTSLHGAVAMIPDGARLMILDSAVERARACRDRRARQDGTTPRAPARKEEQRRMARRAWCARVRSALTLMVTLIEAENFSSRAGWRRNEAVNCRIKEMIEALDRLAVEGRQWWSQKSRICPRMSLTADIFFNYNIRRAAEASQRDSYDLALTNGYACSRRGGKS